MATEVFKLPDLGEGLPDAEVVEWHVREGDTVREGDLLVSVETDKAVVEVPSPCSGRIVRLHGEAGGILEVGAPLAEFETVDDGSPAASGGTEGGRRDAGTVVGKVETRSTSVRESAEAVSREPSEVKATPAVRAMAKRMNVDLAIVRPSGPDGVVTADDVRRAASILSELAPVEPLRGVRRAMARTMAQSHEQVVPVTISDDADIDCWGADVDVTLRLIRAIVAGCRAEPGLNAWYDSQAVGRRLLTAIDLGVAVDTPEGLFVPVLRDAAGRTPDRLGAELSRLKAAVKSREISPDELRGASFTLTNFGTLAGRYATPVVVPPAVAILGSGSIREAVVPIRGQAVVHRILPLSLTFDHRCITGGEAARFLQAVISDLTREE